MIVSRLRQFVYIAPPRTASETLHVWLTQPILCEYAWARDSATWHSGYVPEDARSFFKFASVRNPYDRAVSLWKFSQITEPGKTPDVPALDTFTEFLDWMPSELTFYSVTQSQVVGETMLDAIVRFEELRSVRELPPITPFKDQLEELPHLNKTDRECWSEYYTPQLIEKVRAHFAEDFERFGYDTDVIEA